MPVATMLGISPTLTLPMLPTPLADPTSTQYEVAPAGAVHGSETVAPLTLLVSTGGEGGWPQTPPPPKPSAA